MTPEHDPKDLDLLQEAVDRFSRRPTFMASLLRTAFSGDVSAARIATEFDCSPQAALRLALMSAPRYDRDSSREDIARIAEAVGIDKVRLLSTVKQARTLEAFGEEKQGMLLAARDVLPDPPRDEN